MILPKQAIHCGVNTKLGEIVSDVAGRIVATLLETDCRQRPGTIEKRQI